MKNHPRIVGFVLELLGVASLFSIIGRWPYQTAPLPVAIPDALFNLGYATVAALWGIMLIQAPQREWKWLDYFDITADWIPRPGKLVLWLCFSLTILGAIAGGLLAVLCYGAGMCG